MAVPVDTDSAEDMFAILCGIWVIFFKFGFALFAFGSTSVRSSANVLLLSLADTFISLIAYWMHGYAFAFGAHNIFIGTKYFVSLDGVRIAHFFFNYARCAVTTTLVSGAVVERIEPVGYLLSSYVLAGFVFPVISHLFWDSKGYFHISGPFIPVQDYAGSGVVFVVGGTAALTACVIIGARTVYTGAPFRCQRHSVPFIALGACMQMVGILGFTVGAREHITQPGDGQLAALAVVNTLLAGATAGLYGLFFQNIQENKYSVITLVNAALTGMIAVCAGANSYFPGMSVLCGVTSSLIYLALKSLASRKIDDPAISYNVLGILVMVSWTVVIMGPIYFLMKHLGIFRVPDYLELLGIDKLRHEQSYPPEKKEIKSKRERRNVNRVTYME
nr:PREDICTED: putative ammonium transporter 1 isoform X2 [Latimeria chalumnae]|eukprot:XP_014347773.1 PREDICTED: putative ammonium transporter 1 isoform X2 [Latimeria chalumnae]